MKTLGTRELHIIRRTMELYTELMKTSASRGVRLAKNDEDELLRLTQLVHDMVYKNNV